jgi:hypothetical protein
MRFKRAAEGLVQPKEAAAHKRVVDGASAEATRERERPLGAHLRNGMGWDGMGWDGMGWDGMGWDVVRP